MLIAYDRISLSNRIQLVGNLIDAVHVSVINLLSVSLIKKKPKTTPLIMVETAIAAVIFLKLGFNPILSHLYRFSLYSNGIIPTLRQKILLKYCDVLYPTRSATS